MDGDEKTMKQWPRSELFAAADDDRYRRLFIREARMRAATLSFAPGDRVVEHLHPGSDEIFFIVEGEGTLVSGGERCELAPGDAVWVPAGGPHAILARGETPLVMLAVVAPDLGDDSVFVDRPFPIE